MISDSFGNWLMSMLNHLFHDSLTNNKAKEKTSAIQYYLAYWKGSSLVCPKSHRSWLLPLCSKSNPMNSWLVHHHAKHPREQNIPVNMLLYEFMYEEKRWYDHVYVENSRNMCVVPTIFQSLTFIIHHPSFQMPRPGTCYTSTGKEWNANGHH